MSGCFPEDTTAGSRRESGWPIPSLLLLHNLPVTHVSQHSSQLFTIRFFMCSIRFLLCADAQSHWLHLLDFCRLDSAALGRATLGTRLYPRPPAAARHTHMIRIYRPMMRID